MHRQEGISGGRWIHIVLVTCSLGIVGCQGDNDQGPHDFTADRADWVSQFCGFEGFDARDPPSRASAPVGLDTILDLEAGRIGAIGSSPTGVIAVFDDLNARIVVVDEIGDITEFGRAGSGPGELAGVTAGVERDHISVSSQSYLVFDGARIHEFDLSGRPLFSRAIGELGIARIHFVGLRATAADHWIGVMEWSLSAPQRRLQIYRWDEGALEPIGGVALTPLARLPSGAWTWRRFIPMPLWDIAENCAVLSDGSSSEFVVLSLRSGARRALLVNGHPVSDRELVRLQIAEQDRILDITRENQLPFSEVAVTEPRRWSGLRYGRDGSLWVIPVVGPGQGALALRVPLSFSAPDAHIVELPGMPVAFLEGGVPLFLENEHGEAWANRIVRGPIRDF